MGDSAPQFASLCTRALSLSASPPARSPDPCACVRTLTLRPSLTKIRAPAPACGAARSCFPFASALPMPRASDRKAATAAAVKRLAEARRARGGGSATLAAAAASALPDHSGEGGGNRSEEEEEAALSARATRVLVSSDEEDGDGVESDDLADAMAELNVGASVAATGAGRGRGRGRGKAAATAAAPPGAPPPPTPPPPPLVLGPGSAYELIMRGDVAAKLYPHQREGVAWLHSLLVAGGTRAATGLSRGRPPTWGGLLADDMGLGKTMQVSAFLAGAIDSGLARRALVVAPKTLLAQWAAELGGVGLGGLVFEYLSPNAAEREAALAAVATPGKGRGILLTTYGMVLHNSAALASAFGKGKEEIGAARSALHPTSFPHSACSLSLSIHTPLYLSLSLITQCPASPPTTTTAPGTPSSAMKATS